MRQLDSDRQRLRLTLFVLATFGMACSSRRLGDAPATGPVVTIPSAASASSAPVRQPNVKNDGLAKTVFLDVDDESGEVKGTVGASGKVIVRLRRGAPLELDTCEDKASCRTQFSVESRGLDGSGWAKGMHLEFITLLTRASRCGTYPEGALALLSADGTLSAAAPWASRDCGGIRKPQFVMAGHSKVLLDWEASDSETKDVEHVIPWILKESDGVLVAGPHILTRDTLVPGTDPERSGPTLGYCEVVATADGCDEGIRIVGTARRAGSPKASASFSVIWRVQGTSLTEPNPNPIGQGACAGLP